MQKTMTPNFQAARLAAAGIRGKLMSNLSELRKIGAAKHKKTTTPHKKK
jgi:hypothetical protein